MTKLITTWCLFSLTLWANLNFTTYYIPTWPPNISNPGTPLSTGTVTSINHDWGGGNILNSGRSDKVLVHYTGWIQWSGAANQQKTITFYIVSDDGFKMSVDGNTIVNDIGGLHGPAFYNYQTSLTLTAGTSYYLDVWFSEWGGGAVSMLYWDVGDGNGIVSVPASAYATTQPVTYSSNITGAQQTRVTSFANRNIINNSINLAVWGDNNSVSITQIGSKTQFSGVGQDTAEIQGNDNVVTVRQGWNGSDPDKNQIEFKISGDANTVNLNQSVSFTGQGGLSSNGHYQLLNLNGSRNSVSVEQINTGGTGGHYLENNITGNNNVISQSQQDNTSKLLFLTLDGSNNTTNLIQRGTGNHYLDLTLQGNGHRADVTQEGTKQNKATVSLINAGGGVNFTLNQNGVNAGQIYSISQICTNPSGCSVTVNQP